MCYTVKNAVIDLRRARDAAETVAVVMTYYLQREGLNTPRFDAASSAAAFVIAEIRHVAESRPTCLTSSELNRAAFRLYSFWAERVSAESDRLWRLAYDEARREREEELFDLEERGADEAAEEAKEVA